MEKQPAVMVSSMHGTQRERERERERCSKEHPRTPLVRFVMKADLEFENVTFSENHTE